MIRCKYDGTYWEYLGEKWMGQCEMFECLWFEKAPEDTAKALDITAEMGKPDFKCSPACKGYEPEPTQHCKKHNEDYYEECPSCMQEADAAMEGKE